jgi:hypothetical protein
MTARPARPSRRWALLPSVAALGLLFVVPPTPQTVKGDAFITAGTTGILTIEGGECFDDPAYSPAAGEVVVIYTPCAEGADNQSYGFAHAPDGPWNRASLAAFAHRSCAGLFARLWPGGSGAELAHYPIMPTEETWADGDRDVMCVVYDPAGRLPGPVVPMR